MYTYIYFFKIKKIIAYLELVIADGVSEDSLIKTNGYIQYYFRVSDKEDENFI